ncbi:RTA1 like protein-domain-containing protein [Boeremia exigua]|uniref:RTA1 like protein-domain-containing protein n=1 Tax=Boeremia exigua TaxID=749465 RepID=UPI001E8E4AFD|nr:RTA1 like protein-domain-containing protein [Boeremia exigua]KAH6615407.1 RTA1 like protein-domain-containing protein [Boeremia exigua]
MQSTLTLLSLTFYAALIYIVLRQLICLLNATGGGGILASANTESSQKLRNNIILLGLGIQVIFFGFFVVVSIMFHLRVTEKPTAISHSATAPWRKLLWLLYCASLLIMVRSVYRMIEYAEGNNGALMQKEMFVYVLDALLMFLVPCMFALQYPGIILKKLSLEHSYISTGLSMDNYPTNTNGGKQ